MFQHLFSWRINFHYHKKQSASFNIGQSLKEHVWFYAFVYLYMKEKYNFSVKIPALASATVD